MRIHELLWMNLQVSLVLALLRIHRTSLRNIKKVFEVMHVADIERVELVSYQLKGVARTWFDLWKEGRIKMHHLQVRLF